jgi:protein-S-isoprenylcysteine O-methyltransferase Ste14
MSIDSHVIKSAIFFVIIPGFVVGFVPHWWLLPRGASPVLPGGALGIIPMAVGLVVLVWCVVDFATAGQGTLAPIDPPKRLVTRGLYRYVRNPMYWGVGLLLLGQAMLFASWVLFTYLVAFETCAHLFVVLYEEPALRRKFGTSYEEFLNSVPRWWPRRPAR